MAHGGDDGDTGGGHSPGDLLLVKGPQLLNGAAATTQKDHVRRADGVKTLYRVHQLGFGTVALHQHRVEYHLCQRITAAQHVEHIPHRRASG